MLQDRHNPDGLPPVAITSAFPAHDPAAMTALLAKYEHLNEGFLLPLWDMGTLPQSVGPANANGTTNPENAHVMENTQINTDRNNKNTPASGTSDSKDFMAQAPNEIRRWEAYGDGAKDGASGSKGRRAAGGKDRSGAGLRWFSTRAGLGRDMPTEAPTPVLGTARQGTGNRRLCTNAPRLDISASTTISTSQTTDSITKKQKHWAWDWDAAAAAASLDPATDPHKAPCDQTLEAEYLDFSAKAGPARGFQASRSTIGSGKRGFCSSAVTSVAPKREQPASARAASVDSESLADAIAASVKSDIPNAVAKTINTPQYKKPVIAHAASANTHPPTNSAVMPSPTPSPAKVFRSTTMTPKADKGPIDAQALLAAKRKVWRAQAIQHAAETKAANTNAEAGRKATLARVQTAIQKRYKIPGVVDYQVHPFGSTAYGVCSASSDLDLVIVVSVSFSIAW